MAKPILLTIDDELQVLNAIVRDLRARWGSEYRIVRAESGGEALKFVQEFKRRGDAVALFLVDQRMPGMTGTELAETARQSYPELPVLFISGSWDASNTVPSMAIRRELLLSKPFDLADLDEAVRLALDRRTDTGNPRILPPVPPQA